jgi:hypothetical protein
MFELIRRHRHGSQAVLCSLRPARADGRDLRQLPIEERKRATGQAGAPVASSLAVNEHYVGNGAICVPAGRLTGS